MNRRTLIIGEELKYCGGKLGRALKHEASTSRID